jgi:hypothetical protein
VIEWLIPWWGWFIVGFALLLLELSSPGGFLFLVLRCWSHWRECAGVAGDRPGSVGSAQLKQRRRDLSDVGSMLTLAMNVIKEGKPNGLTAPPAGLTSG